MDMEMFEKKVEPFVQHEHVNFFELVSFDVDGLWVYVLHGVRTLLAGLLLIT